METKLDGRKSAFLTLSVLSIVLAGVFGPLAGCPAKPANHAPAANDDGFPVNRDSLDNVLNVLANDSTEPDTGETLSITGTGTPDRGGTVTVSGGTSLLYTPAAGFTGTEVFTYTISNVSVLARLGAPPRNMAPQPVTPIRQRN